MGPRCFAFTERGLALAFAAAPNLLVNGQACGAAVVVHHGRALVVNSWGEGPAWSWGFMRRERSILCWKGRDRHGEILSELESSELIQC